MDIEPELDGRSLRSRGRFLVKERSASQSYLEVSLVMSIELCERERMYLKVEEQEKLAAFLKNLRPYLLQGANASSR